MIVIYDFRKFSSNYDASKTGIFVSYFGLYFTYFSFFEKRFSKNIVDLHRIKTWIIRINS